MNEYKYLTHVLFIESLLIVGIAYVLLYVLPLFMIGLSQFQITVYMWSGAGMLAAPALHLIIVSVIRMNGDAPIGVKTMWWVSILVLNLVIFAIDYTLNRSFNNPTTIEEKFNEPKYTPTLYALRVVRFDTRSHDHNNQCV